MRFQAHKGVSTENPENTMPALIAAVEQGYDVIEVDVSVTKDMKFVLLHDAAINRTGRTEEGKEIPEPLKIGEITYAEALKYDFGIFLAGKFRGTRLPLFSRVLEWATEQKIPLKIDNKYQRFSPEQKEAFFRLLAPYTRVAELTCSNVEEIKLARRKLPDVRIHYDGTVTEEILISLRTLLPKEHLTVWIPHKNPATSWVKVPFASKPLADLIKQYASLGVWILSRQSHLEEAQAMGADIVETNGQLKPPARKGLVADMHTHSRYSHDSDADPEKLYLAQKKTGTTFFALTDHFDTASFSRYDIFTPIHESCSEIRGLREKYGDENLLTGIEMGEGFWFPEKWEQIYTSEEYDVIIGSVHLVKYKELTRAYSGIDFSLLEKGVIEEYADAYFDDMLTMIEISDFDILAHLTCPLRYINGKYQAGLEIDRYREKIDKILREIICRGIALEVNTSAFAAESTFLPDRDILQRYYEMGGYLITLGSDAHIPENASAHFADALALLQEIGFEHIYYYKKRRPYQITIGRKQV